MLIVWVSFKIQIISQNNYVIYIDDWVKTKVKYYKPTLVNVTNSEYQSLRNFFESASIENISMASKRTSKSARTTIILYLLEENDSENADEYFESSHENVAENSGILLKFVNENGLKVADNDACNCDNSLDIEVA